jgi:hypothetical protein
MASATPCWHFRHLTSIDPRTMIATCGRPERPGCIVMSSSGCAELVREPAYTSRRGYARSTMRARAGFRRGAQFAAMSVCQRRCLGLVRGFTIMRRLRSLGLRLLRTPSSPGLGAVASRSEARDDAGSGIQRAEDACGEGTATASRRRARACSTAFRAASLSSCGSTSDLNAG